LGETLVLNISKIQLPSEPNIVATPNLSEILAANNSSEILSAKDILDATQPLLVLKRKTFVLAEPPIKAAVWLSHGSSDGDTTGGAPWEVSEST
jgi:hypothetical protein